MTFTLSKYFTEKDIIEFINILKKYRPKKIHYYDSFTEIEFTTFREQYLDKENYENNKIVIIKDTLYVTERNDSIILVKPKTCNLNDSKYDLLIRNFLPECCDHLHKYRIDNNIQNIEYNSVCYIDKINFEEIGISKFKDFKYYFDICDISEILDNCIILSDLIFKLNQPQNIHKKNIHYNEIKLYMNKQETLFDVFKLFYGLPNKGIDYLIQDGKVPYILRFESLFLLTTKSLGYYRNLQDLQFLNFVKSWR